MAYICQWHKRWEFMVFVWMIISMNLIGRISRENLFKSEIIVYILKRLE